MEMVSLETYENATINFKFCHIFPIKILKCSYNHNILDAFKMFVEKSSKIFRKNSCITLTFFKSTKYSIYNYDVIIIIIYTYKTIYSKQ